MCLLSKVFAEHGFAKHMLLGQYALFNIRFIEHIVVGLEFINSKKGRSFITKVKNQIVFMDLKLNDIPKTRSGKTAELAVRDVIHQRKVVNRDALANPDALAEFFPRQELMPPGSGIKSG